jgi:hypothetical protein
MGLGERIGLLGVILALFGIAATILWPDKKWIGWLSLVCAIGVLGAWVWMEWSEPIVRFGRNYKIASLLIVFILGGLLASASWLMLTWNSLGKPDQEQSSDSSPKPYEQQAGAKPSSFDPIEISIECYPTELPITVPVGETGLVFGLNENVRTRTDRVSLYNVPNGEGRLPVMWPDVIRVQDAKTKYGPDEATAWRCEIRNGGKKTALEIRLPFKLMFGGTNSYDAIVSLAAVPATRPIFIYFVNDCPVPAQFQLPQRGTAKLIDENQAREFQPISASGSFSLGGSRSNWLQMTCDPLPNRDRSVERKEPKPASLNWNQEWREMEKSFRKMEDPRVFAECGRGREGEEVWSIKAEIQEFDPHQYKTLCELAGSKLIASTPAIPLSADVSEQKAAWIRWLCFLRAKRAELNGDTGYTRPVSYGHTDRHTRTPVRYPGGIIHNFARESADMCVVCRATTYV